MARQLSASELQALVRLLGDSDERTARMARERLRLAGPGAIPWLEHAAQAEADAVVRGRARVLLGELRFQQIERRVQRLAAQPDGERFDLEEGLFLVARTRYPELDEGPYRVKLREMTAELDRRRLARLAPEEAVAGLNRFFFGELGFQGKESRAHDPDSACIHKVLERRSGLALVVSGVYMLIARGLPLRLHGVSLPGRFVVGVGLPAAFWVDFERGGRRLGPADLVAITREAGHQFDPSVLKPISSREMVARLLVHLTRIYMLTSQSVIARRLERLVRILEKGGAERPGTADVPSLPGGEAEAEEPPGEP